jgi:hypothetical protein
MTTTTLTAVPSARLRSPINGLVVSLVLFLAAITVLVVLLISRTTGRTGDATGSGGQGEPGCHPTAVLHYC